MVDQYSVRALTAKPGALVTLEVSINSQNGNNMGEAQK